MPDISSVHPLIGLALGDSYGAWAEMKTDVHIRENIAKLETLQPFTMRDGTIYPAGYYTDDTQFSLELAQSLVEKGEYVPVHTMSRYIRLVAERRVRGIGGTLRAAITEARNRGSYEGERSRRFGVFGALGTGTAMRAHPLGMYTKNDEAIRRAAYEDAMLTHASWDAYMGSAFVACATNTAITLALMGYPSRWQPFEKAEQQVGALPDRDSCPPNTVLHIIDEAVFCVRHGGDFKKTVRLAVEMGGDTDTRASIAGGWAGALWGNTIPQEWIDQLEDKDMLIKLERDLLALRERP